jgi:RNA polymerase sigma factor for flagellar operon FliA
LLKQVPAVVPLEDLIQVGMIGLLEAYKHYDASKGASFETYATIRVRGFMLDEIRNNDWIPRSIHRNARVIALAVKNAENRLGRQVSEREIAEELGLDSHEFYELLKESASSQLQGFEDAGLTEDTMIGISEIGRLPEPHAKALQDDLLKTLTDIIHTLPPAERMVLALYYEQDLNLKEIGEVLGVSESRVCQIHTKATNHVKSKMQVVPR